MIFRLQLARPQRPSWFGGGSCWAQTLGYNECSRPGGSQEVSGGAVLKRPQWLGSWTFVFAMGWPRLGLCSLRRCRLWRGALISPLFEGLGPTKEELAKADEGRERKSESGEAVDPCSDSACMEYLSTFTINLTQICRQLFHTCVIWDGEFGVPQTSDRARHRIFLNLGPSRFTFSSECFFPRISEANRL